MSTGRRPFRGFDERSEVHISRNRLPHWTQVGGTYFITFRLGDSIPLNRLKDWHYQREIWENLHPKPWTLKLEAEYEERFGRKIDEWLDAGMGACHLRRPDIRHEVERCMLHFDNQRYDMDAFVIMPNHVHALIAPREGRELCELIKGIKGVSARACNLLLGLTGGSFWMEDTHNRIVRNVEELLAFRRYIAANPEKAGLATGGFSLLMQKVLTI